MMARHNAPVMLSVTLILLWLPMLSLATEPGSRIWATGGVTTIEGSAGGGLVPWALLSGYASDEEWGGTLALSRTEVDDYSLSVGGAAVNWRNRLEFSVARQTLNADAAGFELKQDIYGVKSRLFGDVLYSPYGQWSLGVQHKRNRTFTVPESLGARNDSGTDFYLAASKLFFAAVLDRNLLLNGTLRGTRANQGGLLGFGGDQANSHEAMLETSIGIFPTRRWLVGAEYRQKPDNLGAAGEDDWWDVFVAWVPDRRLAVTAAWVDLGDVGGLESQSGFYLSLQGSF